VEDVDQQVGGHGAVVCRTARRSRRPGSVER